MGAQFGESYDLKSIIKKWQTLSEQAIKVVTLAPELPGALDLIRFLCDMDVIASIGHTTPLK